MAQKTSGRLVALGTAAVTAIYMTGYLATAGASANMDPTPAAATLQPTAAVVAAATSTPTAVQAAVARTSSGTGTSSTTSSPAAPTATTPPRPTATATKAATGAYKDGKYTGEGNSRRGGFDVAVTVAGGRITNVQITRAFTEYPASRVSALPGQVLSRQSAQVDRVSGATYSTQAFQQAVASALSQAKV